ncbi:MAG: glycine cleavage system protein T [Spirochaetae bacterium HGW-Spirochaetae-8]|nr:MAG: glycine cleavage system protein T [Spirochaetae bacterium HGW-Spirochaetae-8]
MKCTPVFAEYGTYPGVRMIDFGGWNLPVNFQAGILAEHHAVRTSAGLFDISHMGECMVTGPESEAYLDYLFTNSVAGMVDGQIIYTLMCYPSGTVVDDLIVYRIDNESYWVVMNAANVAKDLAWITKENPWAASGKTTPTIVDFSEHTAQLALQGPLAERIISRLCPEAATLGFFTFLKDARVDGVRCILSRNGYTGEDGFELYCANDQSIRLWKALLAAGEADGLIPCGLGARDTLRLEAKLPLYGHEISETITPLEANLGVFVKLEKSDFCGRAALAKQEAEGIPRTLRGIQMVDSAVPRNGYQVFLGEKEIGYVTSGAKSPTLDIFCGYALLDRSISLKFGDEVEVLIHGKRKRAKLVKTPFYKRTPAKK